MWVCGVDRIKVAVRVVQLKASTENQLLKNFAYYVIFIVDLRSFEF